MFKALLIFGALSCSAFVAHELKPEALLADTRGKTTFKELVPEKFGEWEVDRMTPVVVADPSALTLVNQIYSETLSRTYVNKSGERIMLSIAYGANQSDALRLHLPETCYAAQGFSIQSRSRDTLATQTRSQPVIKVVARKDARIEPILYWVLVGDSVANTGMEQKMAQMHYGINGKIPDGLLFRVSAIQASLPASFELQDKFINDLLASLPPNSKARIEGTKVGI